MAVSLLLLLLTLCGYALGLLLFRFSRQFPLLHPLVAGSGFIGLFLLWQGSDYADYLQANHPLTWLLGPATVALAVPLYQQIHHVRETAGPIFLTLLTGALLIPLCGMGVAMLFGGSGEVINAMLTKAVTTPVALGIASQATEANPGLVAGIVVYCGVTAAIVASPLFRLLGLGDHRVQGITLGLNGHAAATTRGFEISQLCGAFSSLALVINACITAFFLPLILYFVK